MEGFGRNGQTSSETVVPDVLRGFRHFRLSTAPPDGSLLSLNDRIPYDIGYQEAKCTKHVPEWAADGTEVDRHHVPVQDCTCGIYGWYHPDKINQGFGSGNDRVTATIEVRGRVVMGTLGFRAQAARVVAIALPAQGMLVPDRTEVRDLMKTYDAAIEKYGAKAFRTVAEMCDAFQPHDVSALLPTPPERKAGGLHIDAAALALAAQRASRGMTAMQDALMRQMQYHHHNPYWSWSPASGCKAYTDRIDEFEKIVSYMPKKVRAIAEPFRIDVTSMMDPHSTYLPNFQTEEWCDQLIDITPMAVPEIKHLLSASHGRRFKGVTVVIQGGFHHPSAMSDIVAHCERMCQLHPQISAPVGEPQRLEITLS